MRAVSRAAGTHLARYEVLRPIASGGMAEITLARARDTDRLVVIKKLHPRLAIEPEYIQMFHDEAVIASRLHHPNLVEVYEFGTDGEQHYIAMEYLHGHDLSRVLRRMMQQRIPLMFQHAISIVRDVAAGLHHAHGRIDDEGNLLHIIHRDVSPHNVFLTYSGEVKVVDFGIAKASSQIARTRTGVLKGKAAYMSPEQAMGEALDRRTDVFSIGIVLWELTTGRWLYRRKSELETLKAVVETDAPAPSTVRPDYPRDLEKIVMKALARSPGRRWSTAGELRAALDELARSWHFRPSHSMIAKLMGTVFADEVASWEQARISGSSLADHLATAQPEVVELSDDALGDQPDDGVTLETRRGPPEAAEPEARTSAERPAARPDGSGDAGEDDPAPAEPDTWWWRHRILLVGGLVAAAVISVIACVIVVVVQSNASNGGAAAPPPRAPGSAGSLQSETLRLVPVPPAPKPAPVAPDGAPGSGSGARVGPPVPIVFPPSDPDDKDKNKDKDKARPPAVTPPAPPVRPPAVRAGSGSGSPTPAPAATAPGTAPAGSGAPAAAPATPPPATTPPATTAPAATPPAGPAPTP